MRNTTPIHWLTLLAALALPSSALAEWSVTRGSAGTAAEAGAAATPEWTYALASDETLASVSRELLANGRTEQDLRRYNGLSATASQDAGTRVRIPLNWLRQQPEPARVRSVSGVVQWISGQDGRRMPLTGNTLVRVGDEVISAQGTATIELADGSEVRLSPHSRLMFNRLTQYGKSGMVDTRLRLNQGEVHTRVKPVMEGGARFEIETPSAVAAVRGTVFTVQTSSKGSHLQVTKGVVDFGPPGQTRQIPAGYGASVTTGSVAGVSVRPLPPAPEVTPLPGDVSRLPITLAWADDGAKAHRVDVFEKASGRWVTSRIVNGTEHKIDLLDNGEYEVQLAALDANGLAGMPASLPVKISLQARPATLIAPADGATAGDDMPEFQWTLNGDNELARVEIAASDQFNDLITTSEWAPENQAIPQRPLSPGQYYWRVVTEAGGTSVTESPARKLVVNGSLPPTKIISVNYLDSQVRIFWEKVDTANGYRLQLSEEPGFRNIIKEATVNETSAALRLIPGRRYFVRLKALSEGPLTSRWGPGRELYLE
ncbi:FecR family protein [Marinobacter sp. C2H3]|uniref:FecR family protein n=1 Tax=Marinobacter sp. C2H3 TaxID=3119003 RepID=UPI00300E7445